MNKKIKDLLDIHEKEDENIVANESEIERRVGVEFENSEELLRLYRSVPDAGTRFFAEGGRIYDDIIVPVRKSEKFVIRKHTTSQRPYLHGHSFYELIFVSKGRCVQRLKHPDRTLVLNEKQACLLSPGAVHAIERCEADDVVLKLILPAPLFREVAQNEVFSKEKDGVILYESVSELVAFFLMKILDEHLYPDASSETIRNHYLSLVFLELRRKERKTDEGIGVQLKDYFKNCLKSANLGDFAAAIGYSAGYAGYIIKEKLGGSFSDILLNYKMGRAADLLNGTNRSAEDISFELGYANASGFYKQFYNYYGMTPKAFRKLYR